jgi:uncharacterized protein YceH (UPF0502 family)
MLLKVDAAALARQVVTLHDKDLLTQRVKALEEKVLELQVALDQIDIEE